MIKKNFIMACAAAAMVMMPTTRATGDTAGGFLAGAIIGGLVGNQVGRNQQTQRRVVRRTYRSSGVSSAVRAERREIQTSLNYFGFPAGAPDGVLGRKSRAAISGYQSHLNYPVTGQLTQYQKDFLLTSYHRAIAGGAITNQQIAQHPQGPRGLLLNYRDQAAGVVTPTTAPAAAIQPNVPTTTVVVAPQPTVLAPATTEVVAAAPSGGGLALPNFMGSSDGASLASHCNQVSLLTSSNGYTTLDGMTDASAALNEQFCLARTYAVATSEEMTAKIQGFTPQQVAAQCEGFGPAMKDHVASLGLKPHAAVMQDVSGFVVDTGMSPAQLAGTAKICLGVGYRTDNMDVAIGSGLLLVVLGEAPYSELMGHHLSQGFGTAKRADLAAAWYDMGLKAIEAGTTPVFAPGQPERTALIRKASMSMNGNQASGSQVQPVGALPTFKLVE
jgi:peptidoglycan hydrolase-like protein with peptidoglycan-binding domain